MLMRVSAFVPFEPPAGYSERLHARLAQEIHGENRRPEKPTPD